MLRNYFVIPKYTSEHHQKQMRISEVQLKQRMLYHLGYYFHFFITITEEHISYGGGGGGGKISLVTHRCRNPKERKMENISRKH